MSVLQNKIDFKLYVTVKNANPNGDPLNGNLPRITAEGLGEISDVCLKRKIRNRLQDMGEAVFVQSEERSDDGFSSLRSRAQSNTELNKAEKAKDRAAYEKIACSSWIDVRTFGQVFAFKGEKEKGDGVSVGIRGPVSIHPAFSLEPVDTASIQITKSVNNTDSESGKKDSATMGMKHRIECGVYVIKGSINVQLAEKTGFTEEDAEKLKTALSTLFLNDASSARPEGSMEIVKMYWWKHSNKIGQYSAAKVHNSIRAVKKAGVEFTQEKEFDEVYEIVANSLDGLAAEEIYGL